MDWLRNALQLRWIGSSRVTGYSRVLAFVSLVSFAHFFAQATGPNGSDFLAFWSAGKLAAAGHADQAYDLAAVQAVQALLDRSSYFAFVNPPPFILLCLPFGLLPYPAAWIAWVAAGYAIWLACSYRLDRRLFWPIAAFPGALVAGWHAQTGLITGALIAAAAVLLPRRPFAAGLCVGALIIKPHLAILFPLAFLAGRHWRAIAGAGTAMIALGLIAWLCLGTEAFVAYPKSWAVSQYLLDHSDRTFFLRQVTVYAALRAMDLQPFAAGAQTIVSLVVAGLVAKAWARPGPVEAKLALLAAAIPLATPYLFSYDLPFLIVPIVWLIQQERERPTFGWQRLILTALYLSPLLARAAALPLGANLAPLVQIFMVWEVARQARLQNQAATRAAGPI